MKTNVLILGSEGMLGWMVEKHLAQNSNLNVTATARSAKAKTHFDAENPDPFFAKKQKFDYIINCIGIIKPYCKDNDAIGVQRAIAVNAQFPWRLAQFADETGAKVIQIATDCVFTGSSGKYDESSLHDATDVYGKTKSLGEVFSSPNFLNIRCSIIGPELKGYLSLMEWFMIQPEGAQLKGFTHHHWNGITTLQFAKLCETIIEKNYFDSLRKTAPVLHFTPNETVDKYQMLKLFAEIFHKKVQITPVSDIGPKVDRTLSSKHADLAAIYPASNLAVAVKECFEFAKTDLRYKWAQK